MTADTLIGGSGSNSSNKAWHQAYRAVNHGASKQACNQTNIIGKFPDPIQDFAHLFKTAQKKRHQADYDPYVRYVKSSVKSDIDWARDVIRNFTKSHIKDRRAFCAYLVFKIRND